MVDKRGAGFLFLSTNKKILVLKRSSICSHPHTWCLPGGKVDREDYSLTGTFAEGMFAGACRELWEETKIKRSYLTGKLRENFIDTQRDGFRFRTFVVDLSGEDKKTIDIEIKLDKEHDEWKWESIDNLLNSDDTHIGLKNTLNILKLYGV